jgi:uncharacterized phage infection (PIP) family protein YhgE
MNTDKKVFNKLFSTEKVELASNRYEFAFPDIKGEVNKVNQIYSKAIDQTQQSIKSAGEKLIASQKSMLEIRSTLYRNMEDFKSQYKELVGQSADSTQQVKDFNNALKEIDKQVEQILSVTRKIGQVI